MAEAKGGRPRKEALAPGIEAEIAALEAELAEAKGRHPKLALAAVKSGNGSAAELEALEARVAEIEQRLPRLRAALEAAREQDREDQIERDKALARHRIGQYADRCAERDALAAELQEIIERLITGWRKLLAAQKAAGIAVPHGMTAPRLPIDNLAMRACESLAMSDFYTATALPDAERWPVHMSGARMAATKATGRTLERLGDCARRSTEAAIADLKRQAERLVVAPPAEPVVDPLREAISKQAEELAAGLASLQAAGGTFGGVGVAVEAPESVTPTVTRTLLPAGDELDDAPMPPPSPNVPRELTASQRAALGAALRGERL